MLTYLYYVNTPLYTTTSITLLSNFNKDCRLTIQGAKGKMKKLNKRAAIAELMPLVIALVSIAIMLVVGFLIMSEIAANTKVSNDPNSTAAVHEVQNAMADIPGWLPIIVITVIGALLIGLVQFFRAR